MTREEIYAFDLHSRRNLPTTAGRQQRLFGSCLGCSWGKCKFCDFAKDESRFTLCPKLNEICACSGRLEPEKTRLFS